MSAGRKQTVVIIGLSSSFFLSIQPWTPVHGMVPPTFRVCLLSVVRNFSENSFRETQDRSGGQRRHHVLASYAIVLEVPKKQTVGPRAVTTERGCTVVSFQDLKKCCTSRVASLTQLVSGPSLLVPPSPHPEARQMNKVSNLAPVPPLTPSYA